MKKFRYPLQRLKQYREFELESAADTVHLIKEQIVQTQQKITEKQSTINQAQQKLIRAEANTGIVDPELRRLTGLYIDTIQQDKQQLEHTLSELQAQHEHAHTQLLEKKQAVKILENHKQRLSQTHEALEQNLQFKENDELWLTHKTHVPTR